MPAGDVLVFRNFTLIDGTDRAPLPAAAMVVTEGRISWVGRAADLQAPADAAERDLSGAFVIPGLIDLHVHLGNTVDHRQHAGAGDLAGGGDAVARGVDTREWWVIQDGQIRFAIDGLEPFVASTGYLVQVPYRTFHTMGTVGDRPSLRFEVNTAKAQKIYPADETPVPVAGMQYVRSRVAGRGTYDERHQPWVDFNAVVAGTDRTRQFVVDARGFANIILGRGPAARSERQGALLHRKLGVLVHPHRADSLHDRGAADLHCRPGRHRLRAEAAVAPGQLCGRGASARLAMNGYPDLAHSFEAETAR